MDDRGTGETIRAFIAVEIGDEERRRIAELQSDLAAARADVSWVKPANIHLTLEFLGDIAESVVGQVSGALDGAALAVPLFSFEVAGVGWFGGKGKPRVIWAGVQPVPDALQALHRGLHAALTGLGLKLDDRAFKPHLTLGRVRSPRGSDGLLRMLDSAKLARFGTVAVSRVVLMKSVLHSSGAQYSELHAAMLGAT